MLKTLALLGSILFLPTLACLAADGATGATQQSAPTIPLETQLYQSQLATIQAEFDLGRCKMENSQLKYEALKKPPDHPLPEKAK